MKKELYILGEYCGQVGRPVFKDSLGKQLCVGDIVYTIKDDGYCSINFIVDSFVYGWALLTRNGNFDDLSVYKLINYTQIEKLSKGISKKLDKFEIKKKIKKLTMAELEEIVGEPFEIIEED